MGAGSIPRGPEVVADGGRELNSGGSGMSCRWRPWFALPLRVGLAAMEPTLNSHYLPVKGRFFVKKFAISGKKVLFFPVIATIYRAS